MIWMKTEMEIKVQGPSLKEQGISRLRTWRRVMRVHSLLKRYRWVGVDLLRHFKLMSSLILIKWVVMEVRLIHRVRCIKRQPTLRLRATLKKAKIVHNWATPIKNPLWWDITQNLIAKLSLAKMSSNRSPYP